MRLTRLLQMQLEAGFLFIGTGAYVVISPAAHGAQ